MYVAYGIRDTLGKSSLLYLSIGCLTTSELYENCGRLNHVLNSLDQKNKQTIGLFQEKVKYFSGRVRTSSDG